MTVTAAALSIEEPVNRRILAVSEDCIAGFHRLPFAAIAAASGVPEGEVIERLRAMLEAGVIRRIRQTILSTNLAAGALCAWKVPPACLHEAFDELSLRDPFSGHVVIRSTDGETAGSDFRLWTTLKVPQGYSLDAYAAHLAARIGAEQWRAMPARVLFVLGVGHTRRRSLEPGSRVGAPVVPRYPEVVTLSPLQWQVLAALKRELSPEEVVPDPWRPRAAEAGVTCDRFCEVAEELAALRILGRFSTFLEHVKELPTGERVTKYNGLFHWAVPPGSEIATGVEVARHAIITHAYWREGGPEFGNVNVMAVAHGMEKPLLLQHKAAIDEHLREAGIAAAYTNVFWGGRSEIKPSEILPSAFREHCAARGIDPESMREAN
ncbi:MAG: Lrp/AsnC family transcriptional regulator [Chloroflexi bacterium]|nr:Lrp/AsnC family transcriptional regulator [Chloroflexota bacterium]